MPTIRNKPPHPKEFPLAQLRHAYEHLCAGRVLKQRELAEGLIGPAIRYLEKLDE